MNKKQFIALIIYTLSGIMFSVGMCMTLIPEWDLLYVGIVLSCIAVLLSLAVFFKDRKSTGKKPIQITRKKVLAILIGIVGTLFFGLGMCLSMVYGRFMAGIIVGVIGIMILLCLIPVIVGLTN